MKNEELAKKYDNGELDYLKDIDKTDYIYKLVFQWLGNEYKEIIFENLSEEEKEKLKERLEISSEIIKSFALAGLNNTMNTYMENKKGKL